MLDGPMQDASTAWQRRANGIDMDGQLVLEGVFFLALAYAAWKADASGPAYAMAIFGAIATACVALNGGWGRMVVTGILECCAFTAIGKYKDHVAIQGYMRKYAAEKEAER